ncbi:nitrous oxide reductase accessory protein NosL [Methylophaga sp. OBS4]|uniref:nitrous oxide reductase accessory protein NosL n=1 Tax=Methylophaga sp. OBS4 TaxID=2991935 RepID=UPI002253AF0A|nr:nitrous oxide reductase accessory protein NosL [Methylophaga sp. OBS4]MCX4187930.1 nitrous oxide reductase accessory protein NosL [Methylophaga sp. OBS4]
MMRVSKKLRPVIVMMFLIVTACGESPSELALVQQAVTIESGDECHQCGMIIKRFPGPKGQLYQRGNDQVLKFCSTRDMFAYLLDPEHQHAIQTVYVHDMAQTSWDAPDDEFYIDARKAWFVLGHSRQGAMGPTLASFSDKNIANMFAKEYGGSVVAFEAVTQALISGQIDQH